MCGRLSLFSPSEDLESRFEVFVPDEYAPSYNVAPGDDVTTIREDSPDVAESVRWGLVPNWADDPADWDLINARAETLTEKPAFRDAVGRESGGSAAGRCLILTDGFYEWQARTEGKQPFYVRRSDGEPFAMAGLYDRWNGERAHKTNGDGPLTTATIVTTEPNDLLADLHHRMPVVLSRDEAWAWLDEGTDRVDVLDPRPWDGFEAHPVSTAVNDPSTDDPSLVEPIDAPVTDPQVGLDEFG